MASILTVEKASLQQTAPTFKFAQEQDIDMICDMRCAQSLEYWGLDRVFDHYEFRATTKSYLERNLGGRIQYGILEKDGTVVSVSGFEINDRFPTINGTGTASERSATIVGCYTPVEYRGSGYMDQMLALWLSFAPLFEIDTIYLESHNPSMQHLAEKAGYERVSNKYRFALGTCSASMTTGLQEIVVVGVGS